MQHGYKSQTILLDVYFSTLTGCAVDLKNTKENVFPSLSICHFSVIDSSDLFSAEYLALAAHWFRQCSVHI